jgi:APA family basic amino acid/polyamine antiporter
VGEKPGELRRHFGLLQATALNVTMIVGAGVFATIPLMLLKLPGPYALLGWLGAGALILVDGLVWSELGAALPGSGGSYVYLLECYGRERWGRLMAFLFIWQFLLSGPLEIASGLIAMAQFSTQLSPAFNDFNEAHTATLTLWAEQKLAVSFGPSRVIGLAAGVLILVLLYRRVTALGRLTVAFWLGVLGVIAWILLEGAVRFDPARAFDFSGPAAAPPGDLFRNLGGAMILAMYSYLGYYNVCYIGDEVRDPGRTIPRSILLSALLVVVLFAAVHLALLGVVSWRDVPTDEASLDSYSLAATFMRQVHGDWAASLMTLLLVWSCFGSAFAGLLGYSRIPYGAARYGHFFSVMAKVHRVHHIPHVSLLAVGGLVLFWSFFDLGNVINALIVTRILEQFVAQAVGVVLLRRTQPELARPFRMWLYPLPCLLALVGWLYLYVSAGVLFIALGLVTLAVGAVVFVAWSWRTGGWPFKAPA